MASDNNYLIRKACPDEQSVLVTLLEQHFFPREYVNMIYLRRNNHRVDETENKIMAEDIKNKYAIVVSNLPCLVVVHKESNKIVGMNLMLTEENPRFAETTNAGKSYIEKLKSVPWRSQLLAGLTTYVLKPANNSVDIFSEFPFEKTALKLLFLCVDLEHCGRNLATRLMQETVNYAEKKGIGLIYGLFTSPISQKIADKLGFQKFSNVDILSYRDNDGNLIFQGEESHIISVMAKQIQCVSVCS